MTWRNKSPLLPLLLLNSFLFTAAYSGAPSPSIPLSPSPSPSPSTPFPLAPSPSGPVSPPLSPGIKAGYWLSWLYWTFPPSAIHFSYFTHVYYAFVQPDPTTFELVISFDDDMMLTNFTATTHAQSPPVGALLSIGGGASSPTTFANLVATPSSRAGFINSSISVARKYGLDGLDFDWEWPDNPGDMKNLGDLYNEWRAAIDREASDTGRRPLLLTCAVYFASHFFLFATPRSYPVAIMATSLDWVSPMCFDYHGAWNTSVTGAHAALYDPSSNVSTSYGITSWLQAGMPSKKLVMGMPLYGHTWKLKDPSEHGINAPAVGVGPSDNGNGIMWYSSIVNYNVNNSAKKVDDNVTVSAYSYARTDWLGYDDLRSVTKKIEFARGLELGGYFFWALGYDKDWSISRGAWSAWSY